LAGVDVRRADADEQPSTSSLITTMMLLARALSRAPRSSSQVISITIANAGRLTGSGCPMCGAVCSSRAPRDRAEERRAIAVVSQAGR
jgi:hypothetical protein